MKTTLKARMLRLSCISVVASLIVTIAAEIGVFSLSNANAVQSNSAAEESASSTNELNNLAGMLKDEVEHFNV